MTTNPGNAIGTNAAYNGRTSVNAFNDVLATRTRGVVSGWDCQPDSGMTVWLGGNGTVRDVAVAEDAAGNKVTINNIIGSPVSVTLNAAPGANSRVDAIVAYVDESIKGDSDTADNPSCCGLIPVSGTVASAPAAPTDSAIRSAITSDGANGMSAYYVILATVRVTTSLTTITPNLITAGATAKLVGNGAISFNNIDFTTTAMLPPAEFSGYRESNNSSFQDMSGTYTIPSDGLYELSTHVYSANAGTTNFSMGVKALLGTQELLSTADIIAVTNYAGNHFTGYDKTLSFYARKGETIKLQSMVAESKWTGKISHRSRIKRLV